jgi:transposase
VGRAARPPQPGDARLAAASAVSWLVVEPLPAYAPERSPVEALWASLKGVELANLAGEGLDEVIAAAERGIQRIRHTHHLGYSFLRHCGLSVW